MSRAPASYDVAIVGASLAGSAAATVLGRAGLKVALLDKAAPPRDKPCGEGLSGAGVEAARRLGFWSDEHPPLPFNRLHTYTLQVGGITRSVSLRRSGLALERRTFDAHVLTVAGSTPGVSTYLGDKATVDPVPGGFEVTTPQVTIAAPCVVVADGSHSVVARHLGAQEERTTPARLGVACHYQGRFRTEPRRVHIEVHTRYEIYATPLAGGRLNIALLGSHHAPLAPHRVVADPTHLTNIFTALTFDGHLDGDVHGRAPIGGVIRHGVPPGVFLVGDAAEELDPIAGMGMTHALLSGELAAQSIVAYTRGKARDITAVTRRFERQRERMARPLRRFTALTYRAVRVAQTYPIVLRAATSRLGSFLTARLFP